MILLSDGKPETQYANEYDEEGRKLLPEYMNRVKAAYQEVKVAHDYQGEVCRRGTGAPFYTVAIGEATKPQSTPVPRATDESVFPPQYQNFWDFAAADSGGVYFPQPEDTSRLPLTFVQIFGELNCVPVGESQETIVPADVPFDVYDTYAEFLLVVVSSDPDKEMNVQLLGPNGQPIQPDGDAVRFAQSELDQAFGVRRAPDWTGQWTLRLTGDNGTVRYLLIPISDRFAVEFLRPAENTHPVGKPLPVSVRLLDSRGQSVTEGITQLEVEVVNPATGQRDAVSVSQSGAEFGGVYDKTLLVGPTDLGQRDITANAGIALEGQVSPVQGVKRLNLVTRPWLSPVSPLPTAAYPESAPVPLAVDVRLAGDLDPTTAQTAAVQAVVFRGDTQVAGPFDLKLNTAAGQARMAGEIPVKTLASGRYRVVFNLLPGPTAPDGDQAETLLTVMTVTPTPTFTPTPTPSPTATPTPSPTPTPPCCQKVSVACLRCLSPVCKGLLALLPVLILAAIALYLARLPSLNGMYFRSGRGVEEHLRGGKLRPVKIALGSIGGEPAVRLSVRAMRGEAVEGEPPRRMAQAKIEEMHQQIGPRSRRQLALSGGRDLYPAR